MLLTNVLLITYNRKLTNPSIRKRENEPLKINAISKKLHLCSET